VEVLLNIIGKLADDKRSLGRLMQVSPQINALAAPFLYRSLVIDGTGHSILQKDKTIKGRKTARWDQNLVHTKEAHYYYHDAANCPNTKKEISRLGVQVPFLRVFPPQKRIVTTTCHCIRSFLTRKVIFSRAVGKKWNGVPPRSAADTTVFVLNRTVPRSLKSSIFGFNIKANNVIVVFWEDASAKGSWNKDRWGKWIWIIYARYSENRPNRLILVNIESVLASMLSPEDRGDLSACDAAARYLGKATSTSFLGITDIKFVTMKEYLKEYDWEGEFTDEQVKPWLEEVEE
jgi:hypothetical protein